MSDASTTPMWHSLVTALGGLAWFVGWGARLWPWESV